MEENAEWRLTKEVEFLRNDLADVKRKLAQVQYEYECAVRKYAQLRVAVETALRSDK
jgi:hypothetical protein